MTDRKPDDKTALRNGFQQLERRLQQMVASQTISADQHLEILEVGQRVLKRAGIPGPKDSSFVAVLKQQLHEMQAKADEYDSPRGSSSPTRS